MFVRVEKYVSYLVPLSRLWLRLVGLAHRLPIGALDNFNAVLDGHFRDLLVVLSDVNPRLRFRTELVAQEPSAGGDLLLTLGKTAVVDPRGDTAFSRGILTTAHLDDFVKSFFGDDRAWASVVADLKERNPYLCAGLTDIRIVTATAPLDLDVFARAHTVQNATHTATERGAPDDASGKFVLSAVAVGIRVVAGLAAYLHVARRLGGGRRSRRAEAQARGGAGGGGRDWDDRHWWAPTTAGPGDGVLDAYLEKTAPARL